MRFRSWLINFVLLLVSLTVSLIFLEMALRVSDNRWERQRQYFESPNQHIIYRRFDDGLYALASNQKTVVRDACFANIPVSVNNLGFRGQDDTVGPEAVAAIGDSFVEALQVPDGMTAADLLAKRLGRPVINAGVSGYATTHELLAWRKLVSPLHPRLVVLFIYLGNDISGNSCALSRTQPPCGRVENGVVSLFSDAAAPAVSQQAVGETGSVPSQDFPGARAYLRRHLALYYLAHDAKMLILGVTARLQGSVDSRWGLYSAHPSGDWEDAWTITRELLRRFKADVEDKGGRLVLVGIPENVALLDNPQAAILFDTGSDLPADFDISAPSRRLAAIADGLGIPELDLLPVFKAYRDKFNLPSPQFSYSCNGHWNPLGHRLAAEALLDLLNGKETSFFENAVFLTPPRKLLGDETYRQIFEGGVYRPKEEAGSAKP